MKILIINGPNLNLLGKREPEVYGKTSFEEYLEELKLEFNGTELFYFQSNLEGELINKIQEAADSFDGIVLNAGGYTHTSVALSDAVAASEIPVIEVHISNILRREEFRHVSLIAPHAAGSIVGFGLQSYALAIYYLRKTSRD
jgi:3-dehydroquinate dehydratase-2